MTFEYGCKYIKQLKKEVGASRVDDLLALVLQADPFYAGQPAHFKKAKWFREQFDAFVKHLDAYNEQTKPHLRGLHYWLVVQPTVILRDDGRPYENNENSWDYLCETSRFARYLGYVDEGLFIDQRNPDPIENVRADPPLYACGEPDVWKWGLPKLTVSDTELNLPQLTKANIGGETEDMEHAAHAAQPYHVEVWCEKSTMNEVLEPVCERYGANYVTGMGTMSITSVINCLLRVGETGKAARIFYISDFDPQGDSMPRQVARQIEFWSKVRGSEADIKLEPIVLTHEQVLRYKLPKRPLPGKAIESERKQHYKDRWNEIYGGAVELDALQAIYPGELARIVTSWIELFYDGELRARYEDYIDAVDASIEEAQAQLSGEYDERIETLKRDIATVVGLFDDEVAELQTRLETSLEPYGRDLEQLHDEITARAKEITNEFELPQSPESDIAPEEDGFLFDSERAYLDQLYVFKMRESQHRASVYEKRKR
jgi:hypothetical protein